MKKVNFGCSALILATCVSAQAQSQYVTIYGQIDSAIVMETGGPKGSATKIESGVSGGSRLGFKGTEDLGGGMSTVFVLESGVLVDTGTGDQNGLLFGRQAYVGLSQRGIGTLNLGRQYVPIYSALCTIDPFSDNWGGAAGRLMAGAKAGTRQNNTIKFTSEKIGGVRAELAYGFGEVPGNSAASRQFGGSLMYDNGGLTLGGAYNSTDNASGTDRARNTLVLAKYNFGPVIAGLGYGSNKGMDTTDSRDMIAALTFPFGRHTLMTTYVRKDDRSVTNKFGAHQYSAVYTYNLSKRTLVYVAHAKLSNINFTTTKFGSGSRETDLGIKLTF